MPRVSIITPLHNKGPYIAETIRSVIAQTLPDWEMIIVENGSTDDGPGQVEAIARTAPRIRLILAPKPSLGPGTPRNLGLDHATGEWILFLDADDLIEPDYLEKTLEAARSNPSANVIVGGWREFTTNSSEASHEHIPNTLGCTRDVLLAKSAAVAPWILHAAIIRKSSLARNRWPEHLDRFPDEDTAFWFAVLTESTVAWHRNCGALYRKPSHTTRSTSGTLIDRINGHTDIITHNLALAEKRNITILPPAACSFSMIYEVYYRKALESGDAPARTLALQLATQWLRRCNSKTWNTRLRKLIGIANVQRLRRVCVPLRGVLRLRRDLGP